MKNISLDFSKTNGTTRRILAERALDDLIELGFVCRSDLRKNNYVNDHLCGNSKILYFRDDSKEDFILDCGSDVFSEKRDSYCVLAQYDQFIARAKKFAESKKAKEIVFGISAVISSPALGFGGLSKSITAKVTKTTIEFDLSELTKEFETGLTEVCQEIQKTL